MSLGHYMCHLPFLELLKIQTLPLQLRCVASPVCGLFYNSLDIAIDFSECQRDFKNPDYSRKEFNANNSTRPYLHKQHGEVFSSFSLRKVKRWLEKLTLTSQARMFLGQGHPKQSERSSVWGCSQ